MFFAKSMKDAGAKARQGGAWILARLKPCPDTKLFALGSTWI
jgi:hypothetical protein